MRKISAKEVALASVLGAMAASWEIFRGPPFDIPFPLLTQISWDLTGIPIMISTMFYGPITGIYTCSIGCSIIFLRGNIPGGIFKLVAELSTLLGFSLVKKNVWLRSTSAIVIRVLVMTVSNYYLLPFFYGIPEPAVLGMLVYIGIFNLTQALINIVPSYLIYWRIRSMGRVG